MSGADRESVEVFVAVLAEPVAALEVSADEADLHFVHRGAHGADDEPEAVMQHAVDVYPCRAGIAVVGGGHHLIGGAAAGELGHAVLGIVMSQRVPSTRTVWIHHAGRPSAVPAVRWMLLMVRFSERRIMRASMVIGYP